MPKRLAALLLMTPWLAAGCSTWAKLPDADRAIIIRVVADTAIKAAGIEAASAEEPIRLEMSPEQLIGFLGSGVRTPEEAAAVGKLAAVLRTAPSPATEAASGCVTVDPRPTFCPRASCPSMRPGVVARLEAEGFVGLDLGAIRLSRDGSGCFEMLDFNRGAGASLVWRRYAPGDWGTANRFYTCGPGVQGGQTSGDGFDFGVWWNELHPEAPIIGECIAKADAGCCLFLQLEYNKPLRDGLKDAWCRQHPDPKPDACGPALPPVTPPAPPPSPPVVPPSPPVPACPAGLECRPEPFPCPSCPLCPACPAPAPCPEPQKCPEPLKCPGQPSLAAVPTEILGVCDGLPDWIPATKGRAAKESHRRRDAALRLCAWVRAQRACQPTELSEMTLSTDPEQTFRLIQLLGGLARTPEDDAAIIGFAKAVAEARKEKP